MLVPAGKIFARAVFRILALVVGFCLASFREASIKGLVQSFEEVWTYAFLFAGIGFAYDLIFRTNRTPWRFASTRDVLVMLRSATFTIMTFLLVIFLVQRAAALPRSTLLLTWAIDFGLIAGFLLLRRAIQEGSLTASLVPFLRRGVDGAGMPAMLVGSLESAEIFLRDNARHDITIYEPIGIITADRADVGVELRGVRVVSDLTGAEQALDDLANRDGEKALIFLGGAGAPGDLPADWLGRLRTHQVRLMRQSWVVDDAPVLHEIDVNELLSRQPVKLDIAAIRDLVSGRRVLVTGAGGSIGSEICRQVARLGCAHLGLIDNAEFALYQIDLEISTAFPTLSRSEILCDVRDGARIACHVEREAPDLIFHAAALKHVPMMENHPCECVLTNVVGTWNITQAASAHGVHAMVFISTDKAVDPSTVMGATKRLAESIVRSRPLSSDTRFSVVRFGNVLGSAGSVVPKFRTQIERGGPVTVTHPEVERYFMTIPEAVQLVLHATAKAAATRDRAPGLFVLDMGAPVRIMDMARRLIELYGHVPGRDIEIQITGLSKGEKLTEELVDSTEEIVRSENGVIEVSDRNPYPPVSEADVMALKCLGESGNEEAMRSKIFGLLMRLRGEATAA